MCEILNEYREESEDIDEKYDFYLGLADTMWKKGRLTPEIKEKALEMLEEDRVSPRWQSEKIRKERGKVLDTLQEKLNGSMPERKRIPVHKPYKLGWEKGDVYCFQITGKVPKHMEGYEEYIGWYALFYVDRIFTEDWQVKGVEDEMADLYFYLTKDKPQAPSDLLSATHVRFGINTDINKFKVYICESSKRDRPKDLLFLGKLDNFPYPPNCNQISKHFSWGCAERDMVWGYRNQIKYEQQLQNNDTNK